ncbi:MAG: MarR family transcriptional regulator [Bacillota bacterium]|nr:MarR family transcriptional regulator [Bacillota bacterium]
MMDKTMIFFEKLQQLNNAQRALNELTVAYEISFDQFMLLKRISLEKHITPTVLSDELKISRPAVSRKVNQLYRNEYLNKIRSFENEDQRVVELEISNKGKAIIEELDKRFNEKTANIAYPTEQVIQIIELLEKILIN